MTYPTQGNAVPERFTQSFKNLDGSLAAPSTPPSANTYIRSEYVDRLTALSGAIDTNVTSVFLNHIPELREYVLANGESPASDPIVLASQVCLLRAIQIGQLAEALDISDEDSLQEVELAEAAVQNDNTPDTYTALSFETQAAIYIVLNKMSTIVPGGRMCNLIALLRGNVDDTSLNGFSGETFTSGAMLNYNSADGDIGIADTSGGIGDIGALALANPQQTVSDDTYAAVVSPTTSSSDSSGVMGFLTGLVGDATSAASAISSVSKSASASTSALSSLVNNLGSGTLATYVKNNQTTIWLVGGAILLIIVIAIVYAGKRK